MVVYLCVSVSLSVFVISNVLFFGIVLSMLGTIDVFWNFFVCGGISSGLISFPYSIFLSSPFLFIMVVWCYLMFSVLCDKFIRVFVVCVFEVI